MKSKKEILDSLTNEREERLLLAGLLDQEQICLRRSYPTSTKFLSMGEHALCAQAIRTAGIGSNAIFWGGYSEAERGIYIFYPDYMEETEAKQSAPLILLRAHKRKQATLTHRDYLGSLMGLQINRDMIGDILVHDDGADMIVLEEIADFIQLHWNGAGRETLSVTREPLASLQLARTVEKEGVGSVASPRLDNIAALIFGLSRKIAREKIESGLTFVNNLPCKKPDYLLEVGDRLTVRGHGRARVSAFDGRSRKGKLLIRYIKTI